MGQTKTRSLITYENKFKLYLGSQRKTLMKFMNRNNIQSVSKVHFYHAENGLVWR